MVAWTDLSQYKNPACKFAGSCRKFYPATLLLRPWVSTISTDVSEFSTLILTPRRSPPPVKPHSPIWQTPAKAARWKNSIHEQLFDPSSSIHVESWSKLAHRPEKRKQPSSSRPKKIRHATGPLFLPGPQNRRPTNSVSFSPRNPKEFTISKIEVENVSSGFFGLTSGPGYPVLRNRATVAADLNPISTQFKLSTGEIVRR
ncbi:hypothetical protein R3P38DRAFT_3368819 [Favolaschia claudopus]|uniref:Uncharacterized protein n=1 Tax=Favolaschia claudopus TaxID=2862362 RepID=A0AAW0A3T4_9AGAR